MNERLKYSSLVELLQYRAYQQPDRLAYTFLLEDGTEQSYTYQELDVKARQLAAHLQLQHRAGERALLLYQPGLAYLTAFFGCLYAGIVPVPAYPPRVNGNLARLQSILQDAEATIALTSETILAGLERRFADATWLNTVHWVVTDGIESSLEGLWKPSSIGHEQLAFLQYTSGSTALPKGVMLSHGNLLHNLELIQNSFGTHADSKCVIWLPPYHDMGLIGGILQPLFTGYPVTLMAPVDFIQRPVRWLETISRVGATVSGGPNFAYELCVQKVTEEQRKGLDLRAWETAFTGAEPIRAETLARFAETFAECGFRKEAFYPCYGLAEGTLFVTGGWKQEEPIVRAFDADALQGNRAVDVAEDGEGRTLVSSGRLSLLQQQVVVVDVLAGEELPEGSVGEIWVRGASVAQGYWKREEQTVETFQARLRDGQGPFLRTGDLGFVREGELFVTGRLKDLVIIRGRNYYPTDIEVAMQESHPAVRNTNGAAFAVDVDGEERLVVVQEVERAYRKSDPVEIVTAIRKRISEEHQLQVHGVVLLKPASIPKTSSGKIQRHACRAGYLQGTLDVLHADVLGLEVGAVQGRMHENAVNGVNRQVEANVLVERTALFAVEAKERQALLKQYLVDVIARLLRCTPEALDVTESLHSMGIDSLQAVELKQELEERLQVVLPLSRLFDGPSVQELAGEIEQLLVEQKSCDASGHLRDVQNGANVAKVDGLATEEQNGAQSGSHFANDSICELEFPLSHGQRALWFIHRLEPQSAAYNIFAAVRILNELDEMALHLAFNELAKHHPLLRAHVVADEETPMLRIRETADVPFVIEDATEWSEEQVQERLQVEAHRPFDLEQDVLVRVHLYKRPHQQHVLLVTVHHLIADFWSFGVFADDLQECYAACRAGRTPQLSTQGEAYAAFVSKQEQLLASERGEALRAYWEAQLGGELLLLNLPADQMRPPVQTYRGSDLAFRLSSQSTKMLNQLAREKGTTLYTLLLAVYQVLLHRYTGQSDIVVGSPTTGRTSRQQVGVLGYFVNPVALRAHFAEEQTFADFLQQVRQTVIGALEHQEYSFPILVDHLQPQRDPSYPPLFQTMFTFQKSHTSAEAGLQALAVGMDGVPLQLGELSLETIGLRVQHAQFDLSLTMSEVDGALNGRFECNTDLFLPSTMERMAQHFVTLLEAVVEECDQRIAQLPLLTEAERQQMLVEWNDTEAHVSDEFLHTLYERHVRTHPKQIAVQAANGTLTYGELYERANQVGHLLRQAGVRPNQLVAVVMEKGWEPIVAVLGVLAAGGAYLPLDPALPKERMWYLLEHSEVTQVLTQSEVESRLEWPDGVERHCVNGERLEAYDTSPLDVVQEVEDLAYVIFTSGSTGVPKGVMIDHRGAVNTILDINARFHVTAQDRVLAMASLSFDLSVYDIFGTLAAGGTVVVPDRERLQDPSHWRELIADEAVSIWNSAPALAGLLIDGVTAADANELRSLRLVMMSGDWIPLHVPTWFHRELPHVEVVSLGGATEASIWSILFPIEEVDPRWTSIPYGRPMVNQSFYVMNDALEPCPIGVVGNLYIGGIGLAKGYWKDDAKTASSFVMHPALDERLYRTGDQGRWNVDGTIEFLGRSDNQVKIRGFRIELGEIEATLREHTSVSEVVVIAREEGRGEKRLVAYVVPRPAQQVMQAELRQFVKERLPEYMIPSAFVEMLELPLTANGKVDRRALPEPILQEDAEQTFVAPSTPLESKLVDIWASVLRVEAVGVHDNFFALGGDSILSIQIVQRAQRAGIHIAPKDLFQYQTIAELAEVAGTVEIEQGRNEQGPVSGVVKWTPIQRWFTELNLAQPHHWNLPIVLDVPRDVDRDALQIAVQQLVRHHDMLRLRVREEEQDGQAYFLDEDRDAVLNDLHNETEVSLLSIDLSTLLPNEQEATWGEEVDKWQASLHLADGPLIRAVLFDFGQEAPSRLLLVVHHLVVDGVSWRILLEDLQTAYEQARGVEIQLPPKTTSVQKWAERLAEYAQSKTARQELAYWQQVGADGVTPLPVDFEKGANMEATGQTVSVTLSEVDTRRLLQESFTAYNTQVNDLLLTALTDAFHLWTGEDSLFLAVEGHGREDVIAGMDLSRTVGWFTTLTPLHVQGNGLQTIGDRLKSVKEQLRAVPNRGFGYGVLRYLSEDEEVKRSLQERPQPEVLFNYLGQVDASASGDGTFTLSRVNRGAARSALNKRTHLLEINSWVQDGRLQVEWTYSSEVHKRETIASLAQRFQERLQAVIEHCVSPQAGGLTPSDVPEAQLNQAELDQLVQRLEAEQVPFSNIEDIYALSPTQQGMLFHSLMEPQSGVYVIQMGIELRGALDVQQMQRAWQTVITRHPILRTRFEWEACERPMQIVCRDVQVPFVVRDGHGESIESYLQQDRMAGFDLNKAPLLRVTLLKMEDGLHRMVWTMHHLIVDGWTIPLLVKEVLSLYESYVHGQSLRLESVQPYRKYIAWLHQQEPAQAEQFWREKLAGFYEPNVLGVKRVGAKSDAKSGLLLEQKHGHLEAILPSAVTSQLQTLGRQHQLTLNTLVQGAWAILLSRYSGARDVVFGSTVSGRPTDLAGAEAMVGMFINTLPMRAEVAGEAEVLSLLQHVQSYTADLLAYEHTPLVQVQEASEVPRERALFDTLLVFENYPIDDALRSQTVGGCEITDVVMEELTNYPLTVTVVPGESLALKLTYDCQQYEEALIEGLMAHFLLVLEHLMEHPEQLVRDLPTLTVQEQQQLREWNDTQVDTKPACIHDLFAAQVERTPDATAVVFEADQLTYRELQERVDRVARHLQKNGVGPDVFVGVYMERSLEMVVALLGILQAGGAYVPLDPAYPADRIALMLEDSQAAVVLTQSHLQDRRPALGTAVTWVEVDGGQREHVEHLQNEYLQNGHDPAPVTPDNLAYMIYTSGSTGKPKGVMVEHRHVSQFLTGMDERVGCRAEDTILAGTSISFDISVLELFWTLTRGAKVVLLAEQFGLGAGSVYTIGMQAQAHQATMLQCTPSLMKMLLAEENMVQALQSLRTLLLGGEALPLALAQELHARLPQTELVNVYGPTEATVWATANLIKSPVEEITIGRPLANVKAYVLDENGLPVPVGVAGELHIGGLGVARGYWQRPDLTAEKFLPDPFAGVGRMYKTGDLACYLPDGSLLSLGRFDDQVKIRGHRVELGEIEEIVRQHPAVQEVVVTATRDAVGEQKLVAYVVAHADEQKSSALDTMQLRAFVQMKLPDYMMPVLVELEAIPLTPNGKVNRRALPAPQIVPQTVYRAPVTKTQEVVATIWAELLDVVQVGLDDHFFALGGHSLLVTQVNSRVRRELQVELPMRALFETPMLETFADQIDRLHLQQQQQNRPATKAQPMMKRVSREEHFRRR